MSERTPRRAESNEPEVTPELPSSSRGGAGAEFEPEMTVAAPRRRGGSAAEVDESAGRAAGRDAVRTAPPPGDAPAKRAFGSKAGWILALAVAGVIGVTAFFANRGPVPATEENQPNWQYVQKANQGNDLKFKAAKEAEVTVERVFKGEALGLVGAVGVSIDDVDTATTTAVRQALQSNDPQKVQAALAAAVQDVQPVPPGINGPQGQPVAPLKPTLTPGLAQAVLSGDADFVHVFLFDSCAEDGDVVEVLLDGAPFAVVPISHKGTTISIPVNKKSPTAVAIRGVHDGGGGITVAVRTSLGDFFSRSMFEGEVQALGVARQ